MEVYCVTLQMTSLKNHGLYCSSLPYTYAGEENPRQTGAMTTLDQCHNALETQQVHFIDLFTYFFHKY
jgi:hypothetical protein